MCTVLVSRNTQKCSELELLVSMMLVRNIFLAIDA